MNPLPRNLGKTSAWWKTCRVIGVIWVVVADTAGLLALLLFPASLLGPGLIAFGAVGVLVSVMVQRRLSGSAVHLS
jgi:hypothetical protein